ncbi:histidine kinase G7 [Apiospora arundinis]|uniref:Histidine kinase G7 n=1 Tax=Apiospora arundinis TaxID=335852 RepID=A0ABR2HRY0_9PEZI
MSTTLAAGNNDALQGASPSPSEVRFLIVEHHGVSQMRYAQPFERIAHRTPARLRNGLLAVQAYKADPGAFRCILMAWSMPVMGGAEATKEIRAFEAKYQLRPCVIIAMIGSRHPAEGQRPIEVGCDAFVRKPLNPRRIMKLLFGDKRHNILQQRGSLTEEEAQSLSLSPRPPYIAPSQRSSSTRRKQARMQQMRTWSDCLGCNKDVV